MHGVCGSHGSSLTLSQQYLLLVQRRHFVLYLRQPGQRMGYRVVLLHVAWEVRVRRCDDVRREGS